MPSQSSSSAAAAVQVVVRLRPMNETEKKHGTLPVVTASTQDRTVTVIKGQGSRQIKTSFCFNNVFTAFSSQEEVFEETLKPVVSEVMKGYESTVFAYGQTGTGKTHTMEGDLSIPEMQGVIPRSAQAIFETLKQPEYSDCRVLCSYLEIYNEELFDLLLDDDYSKGGKIPKLEIMDGKKGTFCRGLAEKEVKSPEDVFELMTKAQNQRKIGETKMNKQSSRSHCIFTIKVKAKLNLLDSDGTIDFIGKLHLVDLAGSECAKTACLEGNSTRVEHARERERLNINRSLLTLGRVISLLNEQSTSKKSSNNVRIPYRDSKLTRILQESLGGRCKTVVIATLSPSITAVEESLSTLNYAQSANGIVNKPVATSFLALNSSGNPRWNDGGNSDNKDSPNNAKHATVESWQAMECRLSYMQQQVEEAQAALARKHMQQQDLVERAEKAESDKLVVEKKLYESSIENKRLEEALKEEVESKKQIQFQLQETESTLKSTTKLLKATQHTETQLTKEANELIHTLKKSIVDGDNLHETICLQYADEIKRREDAQEFEQKALNSLNATIRLISHLSQKHHEYLNNISNSTTENYDHEMKNTQAIASIIHDISQHVQQLSSSFHSQINNDNGLIHTISNTHLSTNQHLNNAKSILHNGSHLITQSCNHGKDNLQSQLLTIKDLARSHSDKAHQSLSSLESNINTSQSNISTMVSAAIDALSESRNERDSVRSDQHVIVDEWRDSCIQMCQNTEISAKEHINMIQNISSEFSNNGMKLYNTIDGHLEGQRGLVEKEGRNHLRQISQQGLGLVEQQDTISSCNQRWIKSQENFMSNVMKNFQDMLTSHMQQLSREAEENHTQLTQQNKKLLSASKSISIGAKGIVDQVDVSHASLVEHVSGLKDNDEKMRRTVQDTQHKLDDIVSSCVEHETAVCEYVSRANANISKQQSLDSKMETVFESIRENGEKCAQDLEDVVLKKVNEDITELSRTEAEMTRYCEDNIVRECVDVLDKVTSADSATFEEVSSLVDNIESDLSNGDAKIREIVTNQCEMVDSSALYVLDREKNCNTKLMKRRHELMDAFKEKIKLNVDKLSDATNVCVTNGSVQVKAVKSQIDGFVNNALHSKEEVVPIADRVVYEYSEDLSSTPNVLDISDISMKSISPKSDQSKCDSIVSSDQSVRDKENMSCISRIMVPRGKVPASPSPKSFSGVRGRLEYSAERKKMTSNDRGATESSRKKKRSHSRSSNQNRRSSSRGVLAPSALTNSISRTTKRVPTPPRTSKKMKKHERSMKY